MTKVEGLDNPIKFEDEPTLKLSGQGAGEMSCSVYFEENPDEDSAISFVKIVFSNKDYPKVEYWNKEIILDSNHLLLLKLGLDRL